MPHSTRSSGASANSAERGALVPRRRGGNAAAAEECIADRSAPAGAVHRPAPVRAEIPWRPSRWLLALLAAMTPLAAFAVLASEMPRIAAWPLALAAFGHGLALLRREAHRPVRVFVFSGAAVPVSLDGGPIADAALRWRGPLAFLRWRDARGRVRRLAWWPDTLPPARRRELRLAAPDPQAARHAATMAP